MFAALASLAGSVVGAIGAQKTAKSQQKAAGAAAAAQRAGVNRASGALTSAAGSAENLIRDSLDPQLQGFDQARSLLRAGFDGASGLLRSAGDKEVGGLQDASGRLSQGYADARESIQPFVETGGQAQNLIAQILGFQGQGGQDEALAAYEGGPSANILRDVLSEATRTTQGEFAAGGLSRSGAITEELARRLSNIRLDDYRNFQGLAENAATRGQNAAMAGADLATGEGTAVANLLAQIGATKGGVDRSIADLTTSLASNRANLATAEGQARASVPLSIADLRSRLGSALAGLETQGGTIDASGIVGGASAAAAGNQSVTNYLQQILGTGGRFLDKQFGTSSAGKPIPLNAIMMGLADGSPGELWMDGVA